MKLLRVVEGKMDEYDKWVIYAKDLLVEVIDCTTEEKRKSFFRILTVPAKDPYILVRITNKAKNKEYATWHFSPEKWKNIVSRSKTERAELGVHDANGVNQYFFLEDGYCSIYQISSIEPHVQIEIRDKKTSIWQWNYPTDEWKKKKISSNNIPVDIGKASNSTGDEYFYYLYQGIYYASEISMAGSDILAVLKSTMETKKEKLSKELERVKARAEDSGVKRAPIPEDVQVMVWNRDNGKCVKCGSSTNLEFDHIIPLSKGGSNTARNIQLLCEKCNRSKSANIGG
jgi:hypothetical protein